MERLTARMEKLDRNCALPQQFPSKQYGGCPLLLGVGELRHHWDGHNFGGNAGSVVHWATWLRTAPELAVGTLTALSVCVARHTMAINWPMTIPNPYLFIPSPLRVAFVYW